MRQGVVTLQVLRLQTKITPALGLGPRPHKKAIWAGHGGTRNRGARISRGTGGLWGAAEMPCIRQKPNRPHDCAGVGFGLCWVRLRSLLHVHGTCKGESIDGAVG